MEDTELAARHIKLRESAGLTQEQEAEKAKVSPTTISGIESGKITRPHYRTLLKLSRALGVRPDELSRREQKKEQPPLPLLEGRGSGGSSNTEAEDRRLSYISAWTSLVDGLAGDIEEWRYEEFSLHGDPADLPEGDFVLFIKTATPLAQAYRRTYRIVHEELSPALSAEPPTEVVERELEAFERAVRRLSRAMLSVFTERVEQRVAQMASEETMATNVVELFAEIREVA